MTVSRSRRGIWICQALLACVQLTSTPQTTGARWLGAVKDGDVVAAAFPDIEGVDLLSPAFPDPSTLPAGWSNGTEGPTSLLELELFIQAIATRNSWVSYESSPLRSEEGRAVPYLLLSSSSNDAPTRTKIKIYIQAAIHGNEPASDQGVLAFLGKLDADQTYAASLLDKMDILIVPRFNVDGVAYFQRRLVSELDPNRDHVKLDSQQSREVKKIFNDFNPHMAIDLHEFRGSTIIGDDYQHGNDALIAGGNNLNIHASIRSYLDNVLTPVIGARLRSHSLRWDTYATSALDRSHGRTIVLNGPSTQPRSGRNAMGLTQTLAYLFEIRGLNLADQHFQRRVATALLMIEALLEYTRDHAEEVRSVVEVAREDFVNSCNNVVVTDSPHAKLTQQNFTFVDRRNGSIVELLVDYYETRPAIANLTRSRPEAYLIPETYVHVVEKLMMLGLEIQSLDYGYYGLVDALNITSSNIANGKYEGHLLNTVSTASIMRTVRLPAGSFLVSTRQQNAALAFMALEPESIDSYVSFNLIPMKVADEYPIYRIPAKPKVRQFAYIERASLPAWYKKRQHNV